MTSGAGSLNVLLLRKLTRCNCPFYVHTGNACLNLLPCRSSHVSLRCQKSSLQALRLEPYLVISNQTGIPLQLMQPRRGAVQQSFAGVAPSQATHDGLPRAGVPPAGRPSFGQGPPPQGLRSAISAQDADYTSTLDLPTGAQSPACLKLTHSFPAGPRAFGGRLHAGVCGGVKRGYGYNNLQKQAPIPAKGMPSAQASLPRSMSLNSISKL